MRRRTITNFEVRDGARVVVFDGELLAKVTSHEIWKTRWIELELYRTEAGTYVLSGCGRTIVPDEIDRRWVQLAEEPEGVIDRLYMLSDEGARYMPKTSRHLLELACERDDELRGAFTREHIP